MAKLDYFWVFANRCRGSVTVEATDSVLSTVDSIWADLQAPIKYQWPNASKTWFTLIVLNPPVSLEVDGSTLLQCMNTYSGTKTPLPGDALISQLLPDPHHLAFELRLSIPPTAPTETPVALTDLYKKAWKSKWPSEERTLQLALKEDDQVAVDSEAINDVDVSADIEARKNEGPPLSADQSQWKYKCILDGHQLADALEMGRWPLPAIVVLEEYLWLWNALENSERSYALVGHPGIGRTVALIVFLLYRLEWGLPTAIQRHANKYVLFDEGGVTIYAADSIAPGLKDAACWALVDSPVSVPCQAFINSQARIIHAASPGWKDWMRYKGALPLIVELPKLLEIAAIAKENGFDPLRAIALARKWGPSIHTILVVLMSPNYEENLHARAEAAVAAFSHEDHAISLKDTGLPSSLCSPLFFIRPLRNFLPERLRYTGNYGFFIPTDYLANIFDKQRQGMLIAQALNLFEVFRELQVTFKKTMHVYMSTGMAPLSVIGGHVQSSSPMRPGTRLLAGTWGALKQAWNENLFYWMPSAIVCPGVDGVLVNNGDIYAIQAINQVDHESPEAGLRKIWSVIGSVDARRRAWHFVVVAEHYELATQYADSFENELNGFRLGDMDEEDKEGVAVTVWGCVLPRLTGQSVRSFY